MKSGTAIGGMILAVVLLAAVQPAAANNIAVTNVALNNQDVGAQTVDVQFNLSWENSWRSAAANPAYTNWDAAWVFLKVKDQSGNWRPATLSTNSADHTPAANSTIDPASDGTGVFVYRSGDLGGGAVAYTNTRLLWKYGLDGFSFAAGAVVTVSVHAIEMVYVPTGSFSVGSGGSGVSEFYTYPTATTVYAITNEAEITVGTSAGNLYYASTTYGGDRGTPIPAAFPKGYAAFYCMKYEITQGQYADFLNKLTATQAAARNPGASTYRYTITGSYPAFSASAPDRACNWLGWEDGQAYADCAGLRPMTELEYEKACRGPATPVADEYAWGSGVLVQLTNEIGTVGSGTETPGPVNANSCYNDAAGIQGPTRAGIFATASSDRVEAGATYWGIMEMSGNLFERPVAVGTPASRVFTGAHGNGKLAIDGTVDVVNWPTNGAGFRGGRWDMGSAFMRTSDRARAAYETTGRFESYGWRGVRTAPSGP